MFDPHSGFVQDAEDEKTEGPDPQGDGYFKITWQVLHHIFHETGNKSANDQSHPFVNPKGHKGYCTYPLFL